MFQVNHIQPLPRYNPFNALFIVGVRRKWDLTGKVKKKEIQSVKLFYPTTTEWAWLSTRLFSIRAKWMWCKRAFPHREVEKFHEKAPTELETFGLKYAICFLANSQHKYQITPALHLSYAIFCITHYTKCLSVTAASTSSDRDKW